MNYRIGIDLGGSKIEAVLMNRDGEITDIKRISTPSNYVELVKALVQLIRTMDEVAGHSCPVGLGTPGAWIQKRAVMKNCNNTVMNGKPFVNDLKRLLQRPVRIANDADCFALTEAMDGAGVGYESVFGVILGTGVGGGWVINQQLVQGPNALCGEWGHNPLPSFRLDPTTVEWESSLKDRQCYCGQINCIETFLSGPGLRRTHQEFFGSDANNEDLHYTENGRITLDRYVALLARSLASIINIMDPHVIVLGGGVSNNRHLYEKLPKLIERYAFSTEGLSLVVPAKHGDSSGSRGAAWLFPALAT